MQFDGEERSMVPSPKDVNTYDQKPEMNATGVAEKMNEQMKSGKHRFIMCNFAPPDMVGHTGVYEAAVKACEATGELRRLLTIIAKSGSFRLCVESFENVCRCGDRPNG